VLHPTVLFYCFLGALLGTAIGVLPGIGALAAISLLLPVTYHLSSIEALVMLAGVFYGTMYGGAIASILLNLPGTATSAVTCLEGHPLAKQGKAGLALSTSMVSSFLGSMIGLFVLLLFAPIISEWGLKFGPADYFAMMVLGLLAASTIGQGSVAKTLAMVVVGMLLGTVGTDVASGVSRFDFGAVPLMDGISIVVLAMGVFGISEVINSINRPSQSTAYSLNLKSLLPSRAEVKRSFFPVMRGGGIGSVLGALPGTGAAIASFIGYAVEKKVSKNPERFGKGAIEGVASPESANNAAAITAFVPTLTLGIPGDVVMALMLGAMILHGIQPGPMMISEHPEMFWGLIVSFGVGSFMLLALNLPLIAVWVRLLKIPFSYLYPAIIVFVCLGVYSVKNSTFEIMMVALVGGLGYGMHVLRFSPAPLILGFVLGPMIEENLKRSLMLSNGDLSVFITRPISGTFVAVSVLLILYSISKVFFKRKKL